MEGSRPQFDILLGGEEELPQDFSIMEFASARAQEVVSIGEALMEPRRTGLVFQRLPRHMRRRIMSHNAKRMPRQLREAHQRQMEKGGLPPKSKRPSRKYRRRPSNLLEAYNRRQKENVWLETHIWHAKRFHMINKWGYKLPHFPNDKSARACYRGAANHCLLQDVSYFVCIELLGSFESIMRGLRLITRPECGLTFQAKLWCKGDREGSVILFHSDSEYPHGAIGRVSFLWKPVDDLCGDGSSESLVGVKQKKPDGSGGSKEKKVALLSTEDSNQQRKLWMWVHPSYYEEVKGELVKVFKFEPCPSVASAVSQGEPPLKRQKSDKSTVASKKSKPKSGDAKDNGVHLKRACHQIVQFVGSSVKMSLLKDTLVRLRLTGPLSHAVLREALAVAPLALRESGGHSLWWEPWEGVFECQNELWEELSAITSPANVSPHMVLGLTVLDPRDNLPQKRTKAVHLETIFKTESAQEVQSIPFSPIWDPQIREMVTISMPTDAQVNKRRSENLVPGIEGVSDAASTSVGDGDVAPRLPLLLIQRPGSQDPTRRRLGYGSGWDVIAPAGWGKPLWVAMVMRGARAAGLREVEVLGDVPVSRECHWPAAPDTRSGRVEAELLQKEAEQKYFKLPPSKRPNYIRLGISSPFSCPWNLLCQEWSSSAVDSTSNGPSSNSPYVLRDTQKLDQMSNVLRRLQKGVHLGRKFEMPEGGLCHISGEKSRSSSTDGASNGNSQEGHCLVPVKVTICNKGVVAKNAIICLPLEQDLCGSPKCELQGPEEPHNADPYKEKRTKARKEHKKNLMKLRRKRLKLRQETEDAAVPLAEEEAEAKRPIMGPKATADICALHRKQMEKLFLPAIVCVRNSCSREVAGYVTSGGFSFSEARETGYGYVTLPALNSLINTKSWNKKLLVFVRNTSSSHYFPAMIEIVTN